ncbi:MAG: hypothetical protein E7374_02040 [Clostridiales bacterium]|nr:hypothetical protein [Clostridiales bacterium]
MIEDENDDLKYHPKRNNEEFKNFIASNILKRIKKISLLYENFLIIFNNLKNDLKNETNKTKRKQLQQDFTHAKSMYKFLRFEFEFIFAYLKSGLKRLSPEKRNEIVKSMIQAFNLEGKKYNNYLM